MNPTDDDLQTLVVPMYGASNLDQRIDDMTLVRDERDHLNTRPAPRVPRDTEPCPLWVFALIVAGIGGCMAMVAGWIAYGAGEGLAEVARYADAFVVELVRWIGGVL